VSEKISFTDAVGKRLSGLFNVSGGMITVTAPDGRTKAGIEESMLSPEILAKVLLLQLQQEERQDGASQ